MMLKFVPLQRGCSWARVWQEQQHRDREGSDTASTQNVTGRLSEPLSRELPWL